MNITELLCRIFDRRKKGYVEWGDVFDAMPIVIIATIATSMYLYGGYSMPTVYYEFIDNAPVSVLGIVQGSCAIWFVIASSMLCISIPLLIADNIIRKYEHKRIVTCKKEK